MTDHPIDQNIRQARPAVRAIVIPPCPARRPCFACGNTGPRETDMDALDQLASSDVALAAALIRTASSPLYRLEQPVQTVGMALTVLGLRPAAELLSAFITRQALQVRSPVAGAFLGKLAAPRHRL